MLAKELIDRLERLGWLDQEIIEALREQLAQSGARVTPEAVAKLLVDNGQLTRFQATKLIGELRNAEYPSEQEVVAADDLELVDAESSDAIAMDADVVDADEVLDAEPVEAEVVPVAVATVASSNRPMAPQRPRSERKVNPNKKVVDPNRSVWDSFKIYGVAAIVLMCVIVCGILVFVLNKGDADTAINAANELYSRKIFAESQKQYEQFLKNFPNSPHASIARTRLAMSDLYLFADFTDPARITKEAEVILPKIEAEPGMEEERNNLATLLVDAADRIANEAGSAKDTTEKQKLLADLDRHIQLIENPAYVTTAARTSLAGRLLGVNETRARVQRDIDRNIRLDESVTSMTEAIKQNETKNAFDTRMQLLREYPELKGNERLNALIVEASQIQQKLVKPAAKLPLMSKEPLASDDVRSISLVSKTGSEAPGLNDEVLYVRVHGSVDAFAAADGKQLWRRYVGYGQDHTPVPVNPGGQEGVLLSDSQTWEVQRAASKDGAILWRALISEPFTQPTAYGNDILLSTLSGQLISIDSTNGEAIFAASIPQPLEISPGFNDRTKRLYLPGNHSNLYVIDSKNGNCLESFYIGHNEGSVAVPPVCLQGSDAAHVFVIENAGVDYSLMHVLKCNKEGVNLEVTQPPFRLDGNVTVPPIMVQGRRMIVLTDRGQIAVYDIEQTAKVSEQVSRVAEQPASYNTPTHAQMVVGKNQMWVAGTRLRKFDLNISTGRVADNWVLHENDTFIAQPTLMGETLLHARVLNGTSGARVSACDPATGKAYWQTDVGVPVAMLATKADGKGFYAVTSQAALFELDSQSLAAGATTGPIENPGGMGVAMRFEQPLQVDEQRAVMINQQASEQICVLDPTRAREKLRFMTMNLPSGNTGVHGAIAANGLLLPLSSGRVVLMDWQTGKSIASPFQPASNPNLTVKWSEIVKLPSDDSQVIMADDRKKIYRLRISEQIRELGSVDLADPLLGPMVAVNDKIVASVSGPSADFLITMDGTSLEESSRVLLDGRIVWGPRTDGKNVYVQTDDGKLRTYDTAGKSLRPAIDLPKGKPLDEIKVIDNQLLITGQSGWLVAIDQNSGAMTGKFELNQPLSGAPLQAGRRLLLPGAEGLVYITEIPTTTETKP